MLIEMIIPTFKCKEDQKIFLSRLSALPNFVNVKSDGFKYCVTLTGAKTERVANGLQEICNMWGTSFVTVSE
ncbi:hypothetical protein [uncultured Paraglaciecola sp.]|uniref:hypothetical protein n=1 Tax=uncultured Paraglaciecola sp. TaxID=1765024 RepID=UPI0030D9D768|tara:strand:- start:57288 stop:57503 length:216 start_codon:yes stop_codon:yes gene_type:complete